MSIDLDAYLARIGITGPVAADERSLARLHEAHVGSIPFETLDIVLGRPIRLDLDSLAAKLVRARRGGHCFEHNTLFKAVLDRLGFASQILTARVRFQATGIRPRTHMLLRVETGSGAVIADVGFGALGLLRPLPLLPEIEAVVPGAAYRLRHEHGSWVVECASLGGAFTDLYAFTLEPNFPVDIEMANHFVATHDSSPFRREVIAQLTRASGRIRLTGRQFQEADGRTRMLEDDDAVLQVLRRAFGIALPAGTRLPPGDGPTPP